MKAPLQPLPYVQILLFMIHCVSADGTVTGFCNEMTNTTANVALTNFAKVKYQCKDGPDQSTIFTPNTCQSTNLRLVGVVIAQCTTSGQPHNQQFNATLHCIFPVNRSTNDAEVIITSTGTTSRVTIRLDSGQCPSGAIVSSVPSGPGYNVTVETIKPNCSGWGDIVSYNFTIVCVSNCTSGYTVSGNSSAPVWVFPDVGSGVFTVTVTAENSCGEQTVLAQEQISVDLRERTSQREDSSAGCNMTCIISIAVVAVICAIACLVCTGASVVLCYWYVKKRSKA